MMICSTLHSERGGTVGNAGRAHQPARRGRDLRQLELIHLGPDHGGAGAHLLRPRSAVARLKTNSPVSPPLARLSLAFSLENPMIGGDEQNPLKKL